MNNPMTQPDFEEFLTDKYGAGNEDATHHHELAQTSGKTTSIDDSHMLEVNSDTDVRQQSQIDSLKKDNKTI